jgi:23S rRNA (uracil1939-C5)-methyltransferase
MTVTENLTTNIKKFEKDKIYEIEITDFGNDGEGIGRLDGFAIFVPGAVPLDKAEITIESEKKSYAFGKLHKIIVPSKHRVESPCQYSKDCGGCPMMSIAYETQLKMKKKLVVDSLERIGKIADPVVRNTMGMKSPFGYRNKAQFPVSSTGIGFYKVKSHDVVDCDQCIIQTQSADLAKDVLRRYMVSDKLSAYDDKTGEGLLRHLIVKTAFNTGEVMVILVINGRKIPNRDKFIDMMQKAVPGLKSIIVNVNTKQTSQIMGVECITIFGKDNIVDTLAGLTFEISPLSFYQVNPTQMKRLYNLVVEYGGLRGEEIVFDLYSGVGSIGLYCAKKAKKVIGIESEKAAVLDAVRNAIINNIVNAEFIHGKTEIELPKLIEKGEMPDVVILDPPRNGCHEGLLATVAEMAPARIVYVSCNPATLARDVKILCELGYEFVEAQPVDMFPNTMHVEICSLLVRKQIKRT